MKAKAAGRPEITMKHEDGVKALMAEDTSNVENAVRRRLRAGNRTGHPDSSMNPTKNQHINTSTTHEHPTPPTA